MVLQFVEGVLAVRPVAIELGERQNLLLKGGDEYTVFVGLRVRPDLDEAEGQLTVVIASSDGHALLQPAAQDDHPALTAPAFQPQRVLAPLPPLACIGPIAFRKSLLDQLLDVGGQAQFEQVGQPSLFGPAHHRLRTEAAIATQKYRPAIARNAIQKRPQSGRGMLRGMLVAWRHVRVEHQPQSGQRIGVIHMAGPARLLGIVTKHGPFLMAVERLDRQIRIHNPRLGQQRRRAVIEMALQPFPAFILWDGLEAAADRILADDLVHAQQPRQHTVVPQRRDVRVALVSNQDRQHRCAKYVALIRRIRARIGEIDNRASLPSVELSPLTPALLPRAVRGRQRRLRPFPRARACPGISVPGAIAVCLYNRRLITRWVNRKVGRILARVPEKDRILSGMVTSNAKPLKTLITPSSLARRRRRPRAGSPPSRRQARQARAHSCPSPER